MNPDFYFGLLVGIGIGICLTIGYYAWITDRSY